MKLTTQTKQTENIGTLDNETLIAKRDEVNAIKEESERLFAQINAEILTRLNAQPTKELIVNSRRVSIVKRPSYKEVSLNFCRRHDAIKETPDSTILGAMLKAGRDVPGVTYTEYPYVGK